MFDGFEDRVIATERGPVHARIGGEGPPMLLLHGFPETHLMWHAVAPALTDAFRVVVCDLPGYGDSELPRPEDDHAPHSKRALAATLVQAMAALGHERFAVAGHDRGGRVGYRMALDSPQAVTRLAVLDIVPTAEVWARADERFARLYWHWPFLARPAPQPETMVLAAPPDTFLAHHLAMSAGGASGYPRALVQDYLNRLADPARVQAMCEDYRAGATLDRELDALDRATGRRIECPLLVLWGAQGALPQFYDDVPGIWRDWAARVIGAAVDASHYIPEDRPEQTAAALRQFFAP